MPESRLAHLLDGCLTDTYDGLSQDWKYLSSNTNTLGVSLACNAGRIPDYVPAMFTVEYKEKFKLNEFIFLTLEIVIE